ncbi:MAG: DUF3300 domain-containing protein [Phycisphaerales bacterium]
MFRVRLGMIGCAAGGLLAAQAAWSAPAEAPQQDVQRQVQEQSGQQAPMSQDDLDTLLGPIALYPDALVVQILQCAQSPFQVKAVSDWLSQNPDLKGTAAQDAAKAQGFDASFIAIVIFPDVVQMLAAKPDWTQALGNAFVTDRDAVLATVQRLRKEAQDVGNLKTNAQQNVQTVTTDGGDQVIVIQPANPQVVYVPQYDPQTVYSQPATYAEPSSSDNSGDVAAAAVIGFAAGVIVGAIADDDDDHYYYAYGGWGYARPYCYPGGYNDFYDHRERMANDYYDHRENMLDQRGENQANRQDNRTDTRSTRQDTRTDTRTTRTDTRTDARGARQDTRSQTQTGRQDTRTQRQTTRQSTRGAYQPRSQSVNRSTTRSQGAFSGYQRGSTERASSARGRSSMSHSRSGGSRGGRRR